MKNDCKGNDAFSELLAVVRRLRDENGCPWDRAQTHESLRRYLIEETYEVVETIDAADGEALREELGDLLLQILFHSDIEERAGRFDIFDVAAEERDKMIRRHPHVFGDASASDVLSAWEASKSKEKARDTLSARLASVPLAIPALLRAQKLLEKCAVGGEWLLPPGIDLEGPSVLLEAAPTKEAVGDFLLAVVEHFRRLGIECEEALSLASRRLEKRAENAENPL